MVENSWSEEITRGRRRYEDNIKIDIKDRYCGNSADWIMWLRIGPVTGCCEQGYGFSSSLIAVY